MEIKEREHQYQVELVKIQHDNEYVHHKGGWICDEYFGYYFTCPDCGEVI